MSRLATRSRSGGSFVKRKSAKVCRGGSSPQPASGPTRAASTINPESDRRAIIRPPAWASLGPETAAAFGQIHGTTDGSLKGSTGGNRRHVIPLEAVTRVAKLTRHPHGSIGLAQVVPLVERRRAQDPVDPPRRAAAFR